MNVGKADYINDKENQDIVHYEFLFNKKNHQTKNYTLADVESKIGYNFKDKKLLDEALTHSSIYSNINILDPEKNNLKLTKKNKKFSSYERLEFLGDSILNFLVTEKLYKNFDDLDEGLMSKYRSWLISEVVLKNCALHYDLDKFMIIGPSEEKTGGRFKPRLLSNVFESVIGAIYLDSGHQQVKKFIFNALDHHISSIINNTVDINPKGTLQEIIQSSIKLSPYYKIYKDIGKDHEKTFYAEVIINDIVLGKGKGPSKKTAQAHAADDALKKKNWENYFEKIT